MAKISKVYLKRNTLGKAIAVEDIEYAVKSLVTSLTPTHISMPK